MAGSGACGDGCPAASTCGDGKLAEDEACDDGNRGDGDGCAASCLLVESGFSCSPAGAACHRVASCGDGVLAPNELCDDANTVNGDGCSARCKLEIGSKCAGSPSVCEATTCGDSSQEGAEGCDDGNTVPLDGCSALCQLEPDCSGEACTSSCGDGLVIAEACDDGNVLDGDGCSADCELEPGFDCAQQPSCEMVGNGCALRVPAVFRDFTSMHVDFRCGGSGRPRVAPQLISGKPTLVGENNGCIESNTSFRQWYTDNEHNRVVPGSILLFDRGDGSYVNRYGSLGEQWVNSQRAPLDGNPLFFPVDDVAHAFMDDRHTAAVPPQYTGDGAWRDESQFVTSPKRHNFLFTTEVQYWFRYEVGFSAQLDFSGDDDLWVFVNGHLALDLGGIHEPEAGGFTIDASTAAQFGLVPGKVYAIKVFQAERRPTGSSFKLTLGGFEATPTECVPLCGDGLVSLGEECDDGVNDGGYGECEAGCKLGPRCGDGVRQDGEDCDDGNRLEGDGCGSACRIIVVK